MDLPETNMLNFFNKVLLTLVELSPDDGLCSIDSLINQCGSVVLGGQRGEYNSILNHCKSSGLLQIKKTTVQISILGQKFLNANKEKYFEVTDAQKQLIADRIVFRGAWSHHARELFEHFHINQTTVSYELSIIDNTLPTILNATVHLFKYLGILSEDEYLITVSKKYSELVYQLTADSKALTEQQLEKLLMENRKLGTQAENAVVDFEKKRLKKLGKTTQAELVRRISSINVAAGYDVESFDGISDDIFPNRFIEVKATQRDEIRFYWSNNEMNVAKKKKGNYWIYMMREFNVSKPQESLPIMIRNPNYRIRKSVYLTIEAHTFLIKEAAVVELSKHSIEELEWYQLT